MSLLVADFFLPSERGRRDFDRCRGAVSRRTLVSSTFPSSSRWFDTSMLSAPIDRSSESRQTARRVGRALSLTLTFLSFSALFWQEHCKNHGKRRSPNVVGQAERSKAHADATDSTSHSRRRTASGMSLGKSRKAPEAGIPEAAGLRLGIRAPPPAANQPQQAEHGQHQTARLRHTADAICGESTLGIQNVVGDVQITQEGNRSIRTE